MRLSLFLLSLVLISGCASLVSSATSQMADNITLAIQNQDDPATVRDGAPAYLLMIDGLIEGDPENEDLLLAGSKLYGSYTSAFIEDEARARRLAGKSLDYAERALCLQAKAVCVNLREKLAEFQSSLDAIGAGDLKAVYAFGAAWAGWIQVNANDWNAVADLAKVTALFERVVVLDESWDSGGAHLYLGVIKSLVPAALGGKPEVARAHFERALQLSNGENLMVKVLMAQHYARTVYDQELHDQLLNEVEAAPAEHAGFTLINSLAKQRAQVLLAESAEFF